MKKQTPLLLAPLLLACGFYFAGPVSAATLVSQYTFAGNANDSVGGKNLTVTGSVGYGTQTINGVSMNVVTISEPSNSNYLNFSGNLGASLGSVSVSFWANGTATGATYKDIVGVANGSGVGFKLETFNDFSSNDYVAVYGMGSFLTGAPPGTSVGSEGAWHLYTFTVNGTAATLYCDGVAVGTATTNGNNTLITQLRVGNGLDSTGRGWLGSVADLKIYSGALTAGEVAAAYAAVPEPTTYGMLGAGALAGAALVRRRRRRGVIAR